MELWCQILYQINNLYESEKRSLLFSILYAEGLLARSKLIKPPHSDVT
jgi:hypothetical protein